MPVILRSQLRDLSTKLRKRQFVLVVMIHSETVKNVSQYTHAHTHPHSPLIVLIITFNIIGYEDYNAELCQTLGFKHSPMLAYQINCLVMWITHNCIRMQPLFTEIRNREDQR